MTAVHTPAEQTTTVPVIFAPVDCSRQPFAFDFPASSDEIADTFREDFEGDPTSIKTVSLSVPTQPDGSFLAEDVFSALVDHESSRAAHST